MTRPMDESGVKKLSLAVLTQAMRDLTGSGYVRRDALYALRRGGLDLFAELCGIDADKLRATLERAHEVHVKRLYRQCEVELRRYPERKEAIEKLIRDYAEKLPVPYSDERVHTAGKIITDPTYRKVIELHEDKRYRRLARIVQAVERLYRMLDPQQRRLVECYYWDDMDLEETARELGVSVDTVNRRRREICELALEAFESAGVVTFVQADIAELLAEGNES